jgi:hypothetical protein
MRKTLLRRLIAETFHQIFQQVIEPLSNYLDQSALDWLASVTNDHRRWVIACVSGTLLFVLAAARHVSRRFKVSSKHCGLVATLVRILVQLIH